MATQALDEVEEEWVDNIEKEFESGVAQAQATEEEDLDGADGAAKQDEDDEEERAGALINAFDAERASEWNLPKSALDLTTDPRTGLTMVEVPAEYKVCVGMVSRNPGRAPPAVSGDPIVHFIDMCGKCNHGNGKFDQRLVVISNYSVFVLQPKGEVARFIEAHLIESVKVCYPDYIALIAPKEFDVLLKTNSKAGEVKYILNAIHEAKNHQPMPCEEFSDIEALKKAVNLKKSKNWYHRVGYVHTKAELLQHLRALQSRKDKHPPNVDPRTGLEFQTVPAGLLQRMRSYAYCPNVGDPIVHFFAPAIKVNRKLKRDKRFCIVGASNLYLLYPSCKLQRCIFITSIASIAIGDQYIALKMKDEFDLFLKFGRKQQQNSARLAQILKIIWEFRNGIELKIDEEPDAISILNLNKGKWQSHFTPMLTRQSLMGHLRRLGFEFEKPAHSEKEKEEKHEKQEKQEKSSPNATAAAESLSIESGLEPVVSGDV